MIFNVKDFGAVGDGKTKDTAAIQQTIDKCSQQGGGQVLFPAGCYVSGTLWLKDNVELHLQHAAELKASSDITDYNEDDAFEQNRAFSRERVTGAHFIIVHECCNVALTGNGVINGSGSSFFDDVPPVNGKNMAIKTARPGQMIYFCECHTVKVEGLSLLDAPYWTLFIHGCTNVMVRGLNIENPRERPNGDGIDIDCCRNVIISDCSIFSGDDCITLRASNSRLKDKSKACENVVVTNCILSTNCNAIRVGVGDGKIKNSTFSNIIVTNTRTGINLISKYSDLQNSGATIQNIRFSNFIMDSIMPFCIASGMGCTAVIENIYFSDIKATAARNSYLLGRDTAKLKNINFNNVEIEVTAGAQYMSAEDIDPTENCARRKRFGNMAFYCYKCEGLKFSNSQIKWKELDAPWKHCFVLNDVSDASIDESGLSNPAENSELIKILP
jgi:polygalacturonase